MSHKLFEYRARIITDGVSQPLFIRIGPAIPTGRAYDEHSCEVMIDPLDSYPKRIYGEGAEQASEIVRQFVLLRLDGFRITNQFGETVQLTESDLKQG